MFSAIALCVTALYLGFLAAVMKTKDIPSAVFFKLLPNCLAVTLVLIAFKVI